MGWEIHDAQEKGGIKGEYKAADFTDGSGG
jgi:hypothetical protein